MTQTKELTPETQNSFLKEWNEANFKGMKQALKSFFLFKGMNTKDGFKTCFTYNDLENLLGLPYTSSSAYAGEWITNTELYSNDFPGFHYIGFAISKSGKYCAILWDKDENEKIIELK